MPTPPKPVAVLNMEKRSHRTKKELEQREKAEKAQMTGKRMKEAPDVRKDAAAHAVWLRVKSLLGCIDKDDALYEQAMNRYCRLASETASCEIERERLERIARKLDELDENGEIESKDYVQQIQAVMEQKMDVESLMMRKRKMMMDIEKENVMTIASSLRAVPKRPAEEEPDEMLRLMERRRG